MISIVIYYLDIRVSASDYNTMSEYENCIRNTLQLGDGDTLYRELVKRLRFTEQLVLSDPEWVLAYMGHLLGFVLLARPDKLPVIVIGELEEYLQVYINHQTVRLGRRWRAAIKRIIRAAVRDLYQQFHEPPNYLSVGRLDQ